jgi:hypothetical protein
MRELNVEMIAAYSPQAVDAANEISGRGRTVIDFMEE